MGINWHSFFFLFFALLTCSFAVAVALTSNVVRMAFYLTVALGSTAGLFYLAGADFVGAMQLLIYVGGTLVLLVFGVMLTAQGPFISMRAKGGDWVLAAVVGGSMLALLTVVALSVHDWRSNPVQPPIAAPTATDMGMAMLGMRVDAIDLSADQQPLAPGLSGYLLPFEVISVHLLVVLIGAAYLARAKKRTRSTPADSN